MIVSEERRPLKRTTLEFFNVHQPEFRVPIPDDTLLTWAIINLLCSICKERATGVQSMAPFRHNRGLVPT